MQDISKTAPENPGENQPPIDSDTTPPTAPQAVKRKLPQLSKRRTVAGAIALVVALAGAWLWHGHNKPVAMVATQTSSGQAAKQSETKVQGLQLDPNKNYGNKYANGILPVGDGKYSTSGPKVGYVYACSTYARNLQTDNGGASVRGPWFTNNNTQYDLNKKVSVQGHVMWQAQMSNKVSGNIRTIITNDLPDEPTGIFPISPSDPAYAYDRNPNSIKGQTLTYNLNADPTYGSPNCMSGQSGIMLTGVVQFDGFDAGGRDAGAWEVQDGCQGHPQSSGVYHYHTLSSCIQDVSVKTVIGFALDGFPITGPKVGNDNFLTTSDLDVCHGITSQIVLDGKSVTMYHYVMTQDFPYSVSCFRGTAIQPPGMQQGGGQQQQTVPPGTPRRLPPQPL